MYKLSALFALLLLVSCSVLQPNQGIKLVKSTSTNEVVLEKQNQKVSPHFVTENNLAKLEASAMSTDSTGDLANGQTTAALETEGLPQMTLLSTKKNSATKTAHTTKTEAKEEPEELDEESLDQAYLAERQAKRAFGFLTAGIVSLLLPYLGIIFFIIGLVNYSRASKSRYITPFGEKRLQQSIGVMIFDSVVLILWFLLFLLLLAIFLLI
jgi:hypothetical protein